MMMMMMLVQLWLSLLLFWSTTGAAASSFTTTTTVVWFRSARHNGAQQPPATPVLAPPPPQHLQSMQSSGYHHYHYHHHWLCSHHHPHDDGTTTSRRRRRTRTITLQRKKVVLAATDNAATAATAINGTTTTTSIVVLPASADPSSSSFLSMGEPPSHLIVLPLNGAAAAINRLAVAQQQPSSSQCCLVQVEGYVIAKREFGKTLCFFDLADHETMHCPVQARWKLQQRPNDDNDNNDDDEKDNPCDNNEVADQQDQAQQQRRLILPGARLRVTGVPLPSRRSNAVLAVRTIHLTGMPDNPQHVQILLRQVVAGQLDLATLTTAVIAAQNNISSFSVVYDALQQKLDQCRLVLLGPGNNNNVNNNVDQDRKRRAAVENILQGLAKEIVANRTNHHHHRRTSTSSSTKMAAAAESPSMGILFDRQRHGFTLPAPDPDLVAPPPYIPSFDDDNDYDGTVYTNTTVARLIMDNDNDVVPSATTTTTTAVVHFAPQQQQYVTVHGWVQNRRKFQHNITTIAVTDDSSTTVDVGVANDNGTAREKVAAPRLQCVIHPKVLLTAAHEWSNLLAPGGRVALSGVWVTTTTSGNDHDDDDDATSSGVMVAKTRQRRLWVRRVVLLQCSPRPSVVKYLMDLLSSLRNHNNDGNNRRPTNVLGNTADDAVAAAARALDVSVDALKEITARNSATERHWRAREMARTLQQRNDEAQQRDNRETTTDDDGVTSILASFRSLRATFPIEEIVQPTIPLSHLNSDNNKNNHTRSSTEGSGWTTKKKPQLDWMVGRIEELMERHPDYRRRPLHILDIGGGQGHLANLLGRHFAGNASLVNINVIDIAAKAVRNGAMRSKRLQLTDAVKYTVADASTLLAGTEDRRVDIVVALHACGTLTDVALAHALRHQASFAICPCCYRSNEHLTLPPMMIHEETDGNNHHTNNRDSGPLLGVEDFWNVDGTIRDRLQSMAELQFRPTVAGPAAHTIAALRAAATQRLNGRYQVQIKSFPVAFSTRNLCLIGSGPHTLKRQRQ